ncbi:glycosyltransferase [Methylobacterium gregans]|uniref:Glycosyl transferase family 2 n=1 Tax=Methylobacterium gregans TaxID=374424 RepID=A0AA37MHH6_9HYPH|nr:glycosyltransferase [Methylobacterium gregans]MDQ0522528.1 GT2 family glycosyltransferase [Methylobacterium gregans]GJD81888.1 hypothetical protein NBEOAGPD_5144 [Methylobacterium gregans]GLS55276.1 hypothetical protein GCM10007886_34600 [Methylobacterium gregans]
MNPVLHLTRDDVRNFYTLCLGRPVESEGAAEGRRHQTALECASSLLLSVEFESEILRPVLNGRALKHAGISDRTFRKIRAWAAQHGPAVFGQVVEDPAEWHKKWHSLLRGLVTSEPLRADFAARYAEHEAFSEALAEAAAHNEAIVAAVEEINSGRCRGFFVDVTDRSRRSVLQLRINGKTVTGVPVLEFRKELQEKYGGSGHDGFDIRFDDIPEVFGLSGGTVDLVEPRTGFVLLQKHHVTFSNAAAAEQNDRTIETLRGYRSYVDGLIDALDGNRPQSVTSVGGYGRNRIFVRPPAPPRASSRVVVVIDARGAAEQIEVPSVDLPETLAALRVQTHPPAAIYLLQDTGQLGDRFGTEWDGVTRFDSVTSLRDALEGQADLVVHLRPDECLEPDAIAWLAYGAERPGAWVTYADSEVERARTLSGTTLHPIFRSALDIDLLLTSDTYDTPLCLPSSSFDTADFSVEVDFRRSVLLDTLERHGRCAFRHVPLVLSRSPAAGRDPDAAERARATVQGYLDRLRPGAVLEPHMDAVAPPLASRSRVRWPVRARRPISLIVPTRDSIDMVLALVASLKECTRYLSLLRVHVISNNSVAPQTERALDILGADEIVRISTFDGPFNWAGINDAAIRSGDCAEIAVCLNNDMICQTQGWDELLRGQLARPEVDIVGGRLLYANGMLQHAGVAMVGGWMHEAMGDAPGHGLYDDRTRVAHECAAVTGAFMAFDRQFYLASGGFDAATFPITHNDVDFCLRAEGRGARILYDPEQVWTHFESVTRGLDSLDTAKIEMLHESHQALLDRLPRPDYLDLAVNPHFVRDTRPFTAVAWPRRDTVLSWIDQQRTRNAAPPVTSTSVATSERAANEGAAQTRAETV